MLRTLNRLLDRDQAEVSGTLHLRVGCWMLAPYDRSTDPVWLRRRVGMVFQTEEHLLPSSIAAQPAVAAQAGQGRFACSPCRAHGRGAAGGPCLGTRLPAADRAGGQPVGVDNSSACAWRGRWRWNRTSCCWTSPTASLDLVHMARGTALKALRGQTTSCRPGPAMMKRRPPGRPRTSPRRSPGVRPEPVAAMECRRSAWQHGSPGAKTGPVLSRPGSMAAVKHGPQVSGPEWGISRGSWNGRAAQSDRTAVMPALPAAENGFCFLVVCARAPAGVRIVLFASWGRWHGEARLPCCGSASRNCV